MNKKIIFIPIIVIFVVVFAIISSNEKNEGDDILFHVTLADPNLYVNGTYSEILSIEKGEYSFRFVPNGSSPEILSITLNGDSIDFSEDYNLIGISHQTGISEYFTWEYGGQKNILISETQEISITINPNRNTMGSVSVYIIGN